MSRIGKQPIPVPAGVSVSISPGRVMINGPLGELAQDVPQRIDVAQADGELRVTRPTERGEDRALHGLTRTLVANMVEGVTKGFEKRLQIQGVGYRAALRGAALELNVGFSHPVVMQPPAGITFEVPAPTQVVVKGVDKQQVGQVAAEVRRVRGRVEGTAERPRLVVSRSNRGIEAQLVDDLAGRTLASASWLNLKKSFKGNKTEQAAEVGKLLAANAKKAKVERVVFDRGGYLYHGRVKALADGAREGGLQF